MNLLRISQYITRFINIHFTALPGNYRKRKVEILREFLQLSVEFLNRVDEEYWLDFGTLLGQHRENDIIPHDIDIDFAMHEKSYKNVLENKDLISPKIKFYDSSHRHRGPKLYFNYKGFDADIYFYEDLGNHLRSYENADFENERQEIPKNLIYPLKEVEFLDKKIFVPCGTKEYLEFVYGYIGIDGSRNSKTGFWEKRTYQRIN